MTYETTVENERVELDGKTFESVRFINCDLVYSGSAGVKMDGFLTQDCKWTLSGAAGNAALFLGEMSKHRDFLPVFQKTFPHLDIKLKEPA